MCPLAKAGTLAHHWAIRRPISLPDHLRRSERPLVMSAMPRLLPKTIGPETTSARRGDAVKQHSAKLLVSWGQVIVPTQEHDGLDSMAANQRFIEEGTGTPARLVSSVQ